VNIGSHVVSVARTSSARGVAEGDAERRDDQERDRERQQGPDDEAVPGSQEQERGEARAHHDERDGPEQDKQHGFGVCAIHPFLLRHPVYCLHEVLYQLFGGAVQFGALLDEVLE
jgi:hypothetical protein